MPRKAGVKDEFDYSNLSDFSMGRISDLDSHMSRYPQMSEVDLYSSEQQLSVQQQVALAPRRQIKFNEFNEYQEDDYARLKRQDERINVQEEQNQIYYVTKSKKGQNYQTPKIEKQLKHNLFTLINEQLEYQEKKNSKYSKVLYRIKQETSIAESEPNFQINSRQSRQVLQICD